MAKREKAVRSALPPGPYDWDPSMRRFDRIADANDAPSTIADSDSDETVVYEEMKERDGEEEEYPYSRIDLSSKIRRGEVTKSLNGPPLPERDQNNGNDITQL